METLAALAVFPFAWPFIAKAIWNHELTAKEVALNVAVGVLVVIIGFFGGRYSQMADTEIINGEVLRKESRRVSCEHSYQCNCHNTCSTDSSGRRSCSESCSTCFEHNYDVSHTLFTNVGDIDIARVDRRGTTIPPRFSRANAGDPVAKTHSYSNYIKAAPNSLFNTLAEKSAYAQFEGKLPGYPLSVFDYHYLNRVLVVGANVPDLSEWNTEVATALKTLGPRKQVNLVVVITSSTDRAYARALRASWLGSKKNDVVVVIGAPNYPEIQWASVFSWSDNELFKVQLAEELVALKTVKPEMAVALATTHIMSGFTRKSMKDFEYLKWDIEPPTWLLWTLFVLSAIVSMGTSLVLSRNSQRPGQRRFRR